MREVVAAVIVEHNRILLTQRKPGKEFEHLWECPGGKVQDGESHAQALHREVSEETGLVVEARRMLCQCAFEPPWMREPRLITFYAARCTSLPAVKAYPYAAIGIGHFTLREMYALNHTPANRECLDEIVRYMVEQMK